VERGSAMAVEGCVVRDGREVALTSITSERKKERKKKVLGGDPHVGAGERRE